jgi:putative ABC transport system permease protein
MRIRHGLRLDEPDDFEIATQDAILQLWDTVSQASFLALIVISSIALMVGGIGVMAIMSISVTERTREIGVRRAVGATRREILWHFLLEAVLVSSGGGCVGIAVGFALGEAFHLFAGFETAVSAWSVAVAFGVSAAVGVAFGVHPALRAARMDPILALRFE